MISVVTGILDFGTRAIKLITAVEVASTNFPLYGKVHYRYRSGDSFQTTRPYSLGYHNVFFPIVCGVEFMIEVYLEEAMVFDFDYLNVRFKYVDKRCLRGVYAPSDQIIS